MYNIKNPERLAFIRKMVEKRGIEEVFSLEEERNKKIVEIGNNAVIGSCSFVDVPDNSHFISEHKKIIHNFKNK